jgi:hypothetical protein
MPRYQWAMKVRFVDLGGATKARIKIKKDILLEKILEVWK